MEMITLIAPDISCAHCQATIEREVGAMSGVQTVSVDVPSKQVNVAFDPSRTTRDEVVAKLDDEGYPVVQEG